MALDIAKYVLNKCTKESQPISNLQLQKILYCIQKAFLLGGNIAFEDEVEAWQFGPVIPDVYSRYCGFSALPISMRYDCELPKEYVDIIDPIVEEKRVLMPWDLVDDIHAVGKAWFKIFRNGEGSHRVIPKELIAERG